MTIGLLTDNKIYELIKLIQLLLTMAVLYISNIRALDIPDNYDRAYSCVSDMRKEKTDRFKNSEDKKRSLVSELLIRKALTDRNIDFTDLVYEYGEHQKPYFKNFSDFCFNISHSGDYVILAVSDKEIGCDIEKIRKYDLKIAERFFTKKEYKDIINAKDDEKRQKLFFLYWVLKESYIKQNGQGLSQPLDSFEIIIDENKKVSIRQENDISNLHLKQINLIPGYCIAVCSYDENIEVINIDLNDVLKGENL